jgi:hypothetical protein
MPVISCSRAFGGSSTEVDEMSVRNDTYAWIVQTNDRLMTGSDVLLQCILSGSPDRVPDIYDLSSDGYVRVVSLSAKQRSETPLVWDVEAHCSSKYDPSERYHVNPILRKPKYNVEYTQVQKIVPRDINGKPICNTLHQPFVPPIEIEDSRPTLVIQKNFQSLNQVVPLMIQYKDAINARPFYGAARHQAKMQSITAGEETTENKFRMIPVTFRIQFQGGTDTWDKVILNSSTLFYPKPFSQATSLDDLCLTNKVDGIEQTEAQPIDEQGVLIKHDPATNQLARDPVYLTYQVYPERNFSLLGI